MRSLARARRLAVLSAAAVSLVLAAGCTMKDQEPPPLTGPSELDQSISIAVSPDILAQDGASQSLVTVSARDAGSQPLRNLTLRAEIRVGGLPVDFGSISARSLVTGNDGKATLVYTAPFSPPVSPDPFLLVDIVIRPIGTNFGNSPERSATIRLVPQGPVIPPSDLVADFTFTPQAPTDNQTVLFDATPSQGSIAEYRWDFGDGDSGSGRTESHDYGIPGTYVVRLTIVDPYGRSTSTSKSITVSAGLNPTATFVFSPTPGRANQAVNFDASASRPAPGATIATYRWNFGDGTPLVTTSSPVVQHAWAAAGQYTVTLVTTDSAGRTGTGSVVVTVIP